MKLIFILASCVSLNFLCSCEYKLSKAEVKHTNLSFENESHILQETENNEKADQSDFSTSVQEDLFDIDNPLLNEIDENDLLKDFEQQKSKENKNKNLCLIKFRGALI
ncbi:hypothetical protein [Fluviispira vulneris]|uniref:hypothetical protein n=1 Tax=Fluviispira vulneris TaxID=2763012 RepID=UPI001645651D|nr:hypothetical protein [Fluviispira vulneris]